VIAAFAICAASLVVITGWAGQLSLSQMAFAGFGALVAAALNRGVSVDIGWGQTRLLDTTFPALPFVVSILVAAAVTAVVAALIGLGALRVRGLLLAVTTFLFAIACQEYLFPRPILSAGLVGSVPFGRGKLFGLDLHNQRTWFLFTLAALVLVMLVLGRLRRSGVGRITIAVRDNADTAAAYTVAAARTKLTAFALAGAIAGFGGAILAGAVQSVPYGQRFFLVGDSLDLVATAVIGGLSSVAGPVVGALWVQGLPAFFPDNALVPLFTSSLGLLLMLMYFPGGLIQLGFSVRDRLFERLDRRLGPVVPKQASTLPALVLRHRRHVELPETVLATRQLTVRFAGLRAVDQVELTVHKNEIVGLIGTNGAGKSTLMNAIGGFVPSTGGVELLGRSVTRKSTAARARLGLGRTFQSAKLFPELTVRETIQVALESRHRTGFAGSAIGLPSAIRAERRTRSEAGELIDFLGLGRYADSYICDLSTGTRRIVEVAGLLALEASVLCLDEPTAGVAQRETEAFGPLLVEIRRELGASMLIVEHDMPLIMSMSDRVYCLEAGRVIAEGAPHDVRNDPRVIASYLGTDERAIARSGPSVEVVVPFEAATPAPAAVKEK
jgi:ABC-type branched-subunit amino acid transport system ATPase component/ABC-type branched-subunit amino acid transport system permease subunit